MIIQRWFLRVIFWPILWTLQFYYSALWWWHSARGARIRRTNHYNMYNADAVAGKSAFYPRVYWSKDKFYLDSALKLPVLLWLSNELHWIQAFSFLCTFVPGSEKSTERTFAPVELSFRGTFAPVELSFLWSEHSTNFRSMERSLLWNFRFKNFRSYETVVLWERIFQELSLQMS